MSDPSSAPQPGPHTPIQPKKKTQKSVTVAAAIGGLLIIGMTGSACTTGTDDNGAVTTATVAPIASTPTLPTSTEPPATDLTIPELTGVNGRIAADQLENLGFTNVSYASATPGKDVVLLLSNWTVQSVEPGPGTVVPSGSAVVLTMTKDNA